MSYITDDVDDNENEKILVFWPFDILEVSLEVHIGVFLTK
jgi:hypothetical protein